MSELKNEFFQEYGKSGVWLATFWLGRHVYKCPTDLWIYQELLHLTRPGLIVETGTAFGGSALFLASMCDLLGEGRVITVDVQPQDDLPEHPRITYLTGSSVAPEMLERVRDEASGDRVMVILDSDHSRDHVLEELRAYAPLVSEGCYLIVEDTEVGRVLPDHGPGPDEAIEEFLKENDSFAVDPVCEKFMLTFQPGGYLRRLPSAAP